MADDLVVKLLLNATEFIFELDRAKAKLEELDAKHLDDKRLTINVDVDDAEARARLAEDTRPEEKIIRVRTEGDKGDRMGLGVASLLTALPMITPLLATATAGVMGLASAFASAAAGAGGLAAVAIPTIKQVIDGAKKGQEGMKGLDAEERRAAQSFLQFQSFWKSFTASFEKPVLSMFTNGLKMLQQLLIDMRPVINAAAQAFTQLEREAAKALGSPFWRQFFNYLGGTAKQSIITFGEAIGNLIKGFAALLMAFRPLSTDMANGLLRLSQRFAEWATHLSSSSGFHQFINYVRQNGPLVVQLIGQIASIIGKLIVAAAPLGHVMLQVALALAQMLNRLLAVHPQLAQLIVIAISGTGALRLLGAGFSFIRTAIQSLPNIIGTVSRAFTMIASVGRIISPLLSVIGRGFTLLGGVIRVFATGAIAALRAFFMVLMTNPVTAVVTIIIAAIAMVTIYIITHWRQVSQFLSQTWRSISTTARTIWNGIKTFFSNILSGIVSTVRSEWNAIRSVTSSVWHGISSFLSSTWSHISSFMRSHASTIRSMITSTWNGISSVSSSTWSRISSFLSSTWSRINSFTRSHASTIRSMITSTWNGISSTTSSTWGRIVSIVSNGASRIGSILSSLASRAFAWGRNLVHEFASGISSMVGSVISAASNVAHAVARFLGFHSPAEEGPGADADKWAPNLMKMFAQGIVEYTPMVQSALARAITPPQVLVNPQVRGMISGMAQAYSVSASGTAQSNHFIQNGPLIHIENLHVRNEQDIQKLQQAFYNANQRVLRAMGVRQV